MLALRFSGAAWHTTHGKGGLRPSGLYRATCYPSQQLARSHKQLLRGADQQEMFQVTEEEKKALRISQLGSSSVRGPGLSRAQS